MLATIAECYPSHGFSKNDSEEVSMNVFHWHFLLLLLLVLGCHAHNWLLLLPILLRYLTTSEYLYNTQFICLALFISQEW